MPLHLQPSATGKKQHSTSQAAERKYSDHKLLPDHQPDSGHADLRGSHGGGKSGKHSANSFGGALATANEKKVSREQQMRARDKMLINNGGTVLSGSAHQMMPMMMPYQ